MDGWMVPPDRNHALAVGSAGLSLPTVTGPIACKLPFQTTWWWQWSLSTAIKKKKKVKLPGSPASEKLPIEARFY